jgi:transcriptional regulator with XRE-family HTH domain
MKAIDQLFETSGLTIDELAERSGLSPERIASIVEGRWTPSPEDRLQIAAVLKVSVEEVIWGHMLDPRNVRYRQFGLKGEF